MLLIPVKDLFMAAIWLVAAFRRTVNWRGNLLRIESGSALVAHEVDAFEHALQEVA